MTSTIAVSGASGLVGSEVTRQLRDAGHSVIELVRFPEQADRPERRYWNPEDPAEDLLDGVHSVIHIAGSPIAGRFTAKHKQAIMQSRIMPTELLARRAAAATDVESFTCASAVGFYGAQATQTSEDNPAGSGFLAEVCQRWEAATLPARVAGIRVNTVRTGLVLGSEAPLWKLFYWLTSFGVNGPLAGGEQAFPWIAVEDLARIYTTATTNPEYEGAWNATAPNQVDQATFVKTLGKVLHRPTFMPVPGFAPAILLGREGAKELALADQPAEPTRLVEAGFHFEHPVLADYLRALK